MDKYKIVINQPFMNCDRVYTIQQRKVKELIDYLESNENVNSIIIFGSSVSDRCHVGSDVDIYVELEKEEKLINKYFAFVFDLWTNFSADEYLKKEINNKGVLVYEKPKRNIA